MQASTKDEKEKGRRERFGVDMDSAYKRGC